MNVDSTHFISIQGIPYQAKIVARPPRKVVFIKRKNGRGAWSKEKTTMLLKTFKEYLK